MMLVRPKYHPFLQTYHSARDSHPVMSESNKVPALVVNLKFLRMLLAKTQSANEQHK